MVLHGSCDIRHLTQQHEWSSNKYCSATRPMSGCHDNTHCPASPFACAYNAMHECQSCYWVEHSCPEGCIFTTYSLCSATDLARFEACCLQHILDAVKEDHFSLLTGIGHGDLGR